VVALGGGAIAQPAVREAVAARGTLVYLRASPERLLERIGDPALRPLLRDLRPEARLERIRALLAERAPHYERAHVCIDSEREGVERTVAALAARVRAHEAAGRETPA
jgi:shikimate kinase